ncbi:MAG TPA: hypothetical protein VFD48_07560 [Pyrinomonadaceae bacterium]|nr:hypothetical protein [Pyrinomonadaceae bacterium]
MPKTVLAGYLVRFPIGGYAWQVAHYLLGLKALGCEVWFYEDTGFYSPAYNPITQEFGSSYNYGITAAGNFLQRIGFGDRWCFIDSERTVKYGPGANIVDQLLREADLLINLGGVNSISLDRRAGRQSIYIDLDPGYTQLRLINGDATLCSLLNEHQSLFTLGENIGTPASAIPTAGLDWIPTRQPVAIEVWENAGSPGHAYTTIGKWDSKGRDVEYQGETFTWRKRTEWDRFLDLPAKTATIFEMAMDVESVPGDFEILTGHGWHIIDPISVSSDPWRYRDYLRQSRGEFTVAKDMNVRLRSGWFSDRAACYLAAGRPVVEQDTGFGDVLPVGPGLHAFNTIAEASEAVHMIESDYDRASAHASEVAREYFAADRVLGSLLSYIG